MSSILTNNSAMVALQTLQGVNSNLAKTQDMISTGKEVSSAKDNAAVWAISKQMDSDVKGFKAISDSLSLGGSTVAVARNASETVTDLLTDIKGKIVAAQEQNVDRSKIQTDIDALKEQISSVVGAAQFNGLNLVDGSSSADMTVLSSLDRASDGTVSASEIEVARVSLSVDSAPAGSVTFGSTAVGAAGDYMTLDADGTGVTSGTPDTVGDSADATATITNVVRGASYEISLSDIQLDSGGSGTAVGSRSFQYVANENDGVRSVADNLAGQLDAYFKSSTVSGDYSVAVDSDNTSTRVVISNASGEDMSVDFGEFTGGDPGVAGAGNGLNALASLSVESDVQAGNALSAIDDMIDTAIDASASFGSAQGRIETQSDFVSKLTDSLTSGIGSLVDANMEEASARLQALQVQQQLATQSLSIANQAPQALLSLFRG